MTRRPIPPGFAEIQRDSQIWWVKEEWASFSPDKLESQDTAMQQPTPVATLGGRGVVGRLPLGDGTHAIVRQYRRGGFVRHFVRNLYWGRPFRPLTELVCTETARRQGVPTIEALAAGVTKLGGGFYRGVFISREAVGCINLWEWLQQRPGPPGREDVLTAVARAIRRLHDAGICHADLNLTNLLVGPDATRPEARIIDFDRGHVYQKPLSQSLREKNLRRLRRSLHKLDPEGVFAAPEDVETFRQAYGS